MSAYAGIFCMLAPTLASFGDLLDKKKDWWHPIIYGVVAWWLASFIYLVGTTMLANGWISTPGISPADFING